MNFNDNIQTDDDETEGEDEIRPYHYFTKEQSNPKPSKDSLLRRLRLILLPLSAGLWAAILCVIGAAVAWAWNTFHPVQYYGYRAEALTIFLSFFSLGWDSWYMR